MDHFSTDRLTAERLNGSHLSDLVALHLDAEVSRYLGGRRSAEVTKAYLATNIAHWERHGFGLWVLRTKDGAFAGRAGIRHILVDGMDEIEIAYTFRRDLWGQGLASEIATALTEIGAVRAEIAVPDRPRPCRAWRLAPRAGKGGLCAREEHHASWRGCRDLPHPTVAWRQLTDS